MAYKCAFLSGGRLAERLGFLCCRRRPGGCRAKAGGLERQLGGRRCGLSGMVAPFDEGDGGGLLKLGLRRLWEGETCQVCWAWALA